MNIHVLMQVEYDYDNSSSHPILASRSIADVEAKKAEMEQLKVSVLAAKEDVQKHLKIWEINNPRIQPGIPKLQPIPQYKGKKHTWTQEQKDEYNRVKVANYDLVIAAAKPAHYWVNLRYAEQLRFTSNLPHDVQDNLLYITEHTNFEIVEVPFKDELI